MKAQRLVLVASSALLSTACEDGTLVLSLADAPVDEATHVVVQIAEIELQREGEDSETFTFSPARSVDLLEFSGGRSTVLLDGVRLPEGEYTGLRLTINSDEETSTDSYVDLASGERHPLFLPAANESLLTIDVPFTIERREQLGLTIDFDLRRSVLPPQLDGDPFELKPALRLVKDEDAASISGTISSELANTAGCSRAVYVYFGHDKMPDDVGSPVEPLASAQVETGISDFTYNVAFLAAGDYTVAFTCDAIDDDPRSNEPANVVTFAPPGNVTLSAGEAGTVNFQ